jgi:hypothetical protein
MAKAKKTGTTVMLHPRVTTPFHRSRRDKNGNVIELKRFEPLQPFTITTDWIDVLKDAIGSALVIVNISPEDGLPRVDWDATQAVCEDREDVGPAVEEQHDSVGKPESVNRGGGVIEKVETSVSK